MSITEGTSTPVRGVEFALDDFNERIWRSETRNARQWQYSARAHGAVETRRSAAVPNG